jgi:hypothetical protein
MSEKKKEMGYGTEASRKEGEQPEFSATDAAETMNQYANQSNHYQGQVKVADKKFPLNRIQ